MAMNLNASSSIGDAKHDSPPGHSTSLLSQARALSTWAKNLEAPPSSQEAAHHPALSAIRSNDPALADALGKQLALLGPNDFNGIRRWAQSAAHIAATSHLIACPKQLPIDMLSHLMAPDRPVDQQRLAGLLNDNDHAIRQRLARGLNVLIHGRDVRYEPLTDRFVSRWVPNLAAEAATSPLIVEQAPPRIVISVLVWNSWDNFEVLLPSLAQIDTPNVELVVLDNGSDEPRLDMLKKWYRDVKPAFVLTLLRCPINLGFDEGNNAIVDYALHGPGDADFLFFLNDDTRVAPDFLSRSLEVMRDQTTAGAVGSQIFDWKDASAGAADKGDSVQFSGKPLWFGPKLATPAISRSIAETGWAHGAAVMVSRTALERVGAWDPRLFAYMEEQDLALRMENAGYQTVIALESHVWHRESGPQGFFAPFGVRMNVRNVLLLLRKHEQAQSFGSLLQTAGFIGWFLALSWWHAWREKKPEYLSAPFMGIYDGIIGRGSKVQYGMIDEVFTSRQQPPM